MDDNRFDRLSRALAARITRRAGIAALLLPGAPLLAASNDASAKPGRKKKKCKRPCPVCQRCVNGKCKPKPDGGVCGERKTCQRGQCSCGSGPDVIEIDGRCAVPCSSTVCTNACTYCITDYFDPVKVCARYAAPVCDQLLPCSSHAGCASNELCTATACPAVRGITNRCQVLCSV